MRKILVVLAVLFSVNASFAAFVVTTPTAKPAVETKAQQDKAMMQTIVKMSVKDYETLTGKKMNFFEKIAFKVEKKRFAKQLKADAETEGFNLGGFVIGLGLGLIGVLLAYIFSHDSNLRKWAWIGWGVFAVIILIAFVL